jgi:hypothetical protein
MPVAHSPTNDKKLFIATVKKQQDSCGPMVKVWPVKNRRCEMSVSRKNKMGRQIKPPAHFKLA